MFVGANKFMKEKLPKVLIIEIQPSNWVGHQCSVAKTLISLMKFGYRVHSGGPEPFKTEAEIYDFESRIKFSNTIDIYCVYP